MDANRELISRVPRLQPALAVKINERAKTLETTADDCDHQRKAERAGAGERLRCTPDSNPKRQALLIGTWEDTLPVSDGRKRPCQVR